MFANLTLAANGLMANGLVIRLAEYVASLF